MVDEIRLTPPVGRMQRMMPSDLDVNDLELCILLAIEHQGWFSYLWFPFVHREYLNFGSNATDAEVHAALRRLVWQHALIPIHQQVGDMPEWQPEPSVLKAAGYNP